MKYMIFLLAGLISYGAMAADIPAWNKEWGLTPMVGRNGCVADTTEEADIFVGMLLHKKTYEWAAKKCGANLNDVPNASAKVSQADKFFESGLQKCYSASDAKSLRAILAGMPPPFWTCKTPNVPDSVLQYKKTISLNLQ